MTFSPCPRCAAPMLAQHTTCPHCRVALSTDDEIRTLPALLAGLLLAGCGKEEDTSVNDIYGVPDSIADIDGDGYSEADGDCDDGNPDVYPEAEETPGDGVDSNCDGEDDT